MQKTGQITMKWSGGVAIQVHASLVVNYFPLSEDREMNPGPPFKWGWVVSLHGRGMMGRDSCTHRNGVVALYALEHVLASVAQDEVLSREEFAPLPLEHQQCVYRHMESLRNAFAGASWAEAGHINFTHQFKGYVAAQYLGDLLPREGKKAVSSTWYRMKKTTEESGQYWWREIEQCQQLSLSALKYPDWGGMPQEGWEDLDLSAVLDEVAGDYEILNAQLSDVSDGHSSALAFWRSCHEDHTHTDFDVSRESATPAHDGLASSHAPILSTRDHPGLTFSRDLWTFRDRGYDEWLP